MCVCVCTLDVVWEDKNLYSHRACIPPMAGCLEGEEGEGTGSCHPVGEAVEVAHR